MDILISIAILFVSIVLIVIATTILVALFMFFDYLFDVYGVWITLFVIALILIWLIVRAFNISEVILSWL